jgi:hypothetical protein
MGSIAQRLAAMNNLWLIGAGILAMAAMLGLVPVAVAAMLLSAFPDTFGPGFWTNIWFILSAAVWLPVCVGLSVRLLYGYVPDAIDRRPDPMAAGLTTSDAAE